MKKFHTFALAAAVFLSIGGVAMAQTVSGGDTYQQGYAAGAAAQKQNNFNTFDTGVQAGQTQQSTTDQAYNNGYQAGLAKNNADSTEQAKNQSYSDGYNDGAVDGTRAGYGSFADGFRAGRDEQIQLDRDYP
jgi:hypothetical protein